MSDTQLDRPPQIIVGVPGPWRSQAEAMDAIIDAGRGRYIVAEPPEEDAKEFPGMVGLCDVQTTWFCVCEFKPRMDGLELGVVQIGFERLGPRSTRELAGHQSILLLRADGGSVETAKAMKQAVTTAMRAGGLAVIIESTGIAHAPQDWRQLASSDDWDALYWTYVTTIGPKRRTCYTCGLHSLGMRDAITDIFADPKEAAWCMHNFLGYVFQSGHPVASGDAFGDTDGQMFKALHEPCRHLAADDPFHNPYGMWRIIPLPDAERKHLKPNPYL